MNHTVTSIFYTMKPIIPRRLQILIRRAMALRKRRLVADRWPIDEEAAKPPANWQGWPEGQKFALVLTHDVDTKRGHDRCRLLADMEERLGFRSSFNFVPERYEVSPDLRSELESRGFEVGVHGLVHDGKLYKSREIFNLRAVKINNYLREWNAVGFRSPAMHHNFDWIGDLNIEYDCSSFDTDPFEPQSDGVKTIFPFLVSNKTRHNVYVELPYTLPQDFTLFVLLKEKNIDTWKRKLDWIANRGGMALINVHPDYLAFGQRSLKMDEYAARFYEEFLKYVLSFYSGRFWNVLPKKAALFFKEACMQHSSLVSKPSKPF